MRSRSLAISRTLLTVLLLAGIGAALRAQSPRRVLLIPLDDRPPCLQWPIRLGDIAGVEVVVPPRELLGRFDEPGRADAIVEWLARQDPRTFDAAIVSVDMLAYGGLVASRDHDSATEALARNRVEALRALHRRAPALPILGASVLMRLAPTADGRTEAYRVPLARWAEIATSTEDSAAVRERSDLERRLPPDAIQRYRETRARDLAINQAAVALVRDGVLDFLVLSQDDAHPRGVHLPERDALLSTIRAERIESRVAVQPGTDEVGMLLLSRVVLGRTSAAVRVAVSYSDSAASERVMPFEDRPLRETVEGQLRTVGAQLAPDTGQADVRLFVFTSRTVRERGAVFAQRIATATRLRGDDGRPRWGVIVADVDPKGDVQGADAAFTDSLIAAGAFHGIDGYAAWNTAGNAIGTALAQGLLHWSAGAPAREPAQHWFLVNRLLDDYGYHTLVRPTLTHFVRENGWSTLRNTPRETTVLEDRARQALDSVAQRLVDARGRNACHIDDLLLRLPWGRLFEAELDYRLTCH